MSDFLPDDVDKTQALRLVMQAGNGSEKAQAALVQLAMPKVAGKWETLQAEVERRQREEWDAEAVREQVMESDDEIDTDTVVGAYSTIHQDLLRVTALLPMFLLEDDDDIASALKEELVNAIYSLVLTLHNPTIKYAIIGGMRDDVQDDAEDYFERYQREVTGTLDALTTQGEVAVEDFPPETVEVIREVSQSFAQQQAQAQNAQNVGDD